MTTTLTTGQTVACDMTGLGHNVIATYVGPIKVSAKYPQGGHKVRIATGQVLTVRKTPVPCDGTLMAV